MSHVNVLASSIASTASDYRAHEFGQMSAERVIRWVKQFEERVREPLLVELDYVLKQTYYTQSRVERFLTVVANDSKFTRGEPVAFWSRTGLLNIQKGGASQRDMLEMFGRVLEKSFNLGAESGTGESGEFVYIDDGVFSGSRARQDLCGWIAGEAPNKAVIHVVVIALFSAGKWHAEQKVMEAAKSVKKDITLKFWRAQAFENRRTQRRNSDVLSPGMLPSDEGVVKYADELKAAGYPVELRPGIGLGEGKLFSSHEGRHLLEQEFLKAGVRIREQCPNLPQACRPLGFTGLRLLGFGGMVVTYRNCPNNCPLVFWASDPWYPLFPRKTNTDTQMDAMWL